MDKAKSGTFSPTAGRGKHIDTMVALRIICAAINFIGTWVYLATTWPLPGIVLGWIPAFLAGAFGFLVGDLILDIWG